MSELPVHCRFVPYGFGKSGRHFGRYCCRFTVAVRDILYHRIVTVVEESLKARDFVRSQWCRHRAMPNGSPPY